MKDMMGNELAIGDKVIYFHTARSHGVHKTLTVVSGFKPKTINVRDKGGNISPQNILKYEWILTCQDCGEAKPDVRSRYCPYALEIHGKYNRVTICDNCDHTRSDDI